MSFSVSIFAEFSMFSQRAFLLGGAVTFDRRFKISSLAFFQKKHKFCAVGFSTSFGGSSGEI